MQSQIRSNNKRQSALREPPIQRVMLKHFDSPIKLVREVGAIVAWWMNEQNARNFDFSFRIDLKRDG